jgi:hypothetical protein
MNFDKSCTLANLALPDMSKLFSAKKAALNSDKTKIIQPVMSNSPNAHQPIGARIKCPV